MPLIFDQNEQEYCSTLNFWENPLHHKVIVHNKNCLAGSLNCQIFCSIYFYGTNIPVSFCPQPTGSVPCHLSPSHPCAGAMAQWSDTGHIGLLSPEMDEINYYITKGDTSCKWPPSPSLHI